jgi:hypothetical protein
MLPQNTKRLKYESNDAVEVFKGHSARSPHIVVTAKRKHTDKSLKVFK